MSNLDELHKKYMESKQHDIEDFNYGDEEVKPVENELTSWQPVAKDFEFEKQILKLKAMKNFNKGR